MSLASKRVDAVGLLREYGREQVAKGKAVNAVYWKLFITIDQVVKDFLIEHEMDGVRYWHHPESDSYFLLVPGEELRDSYDAGLCIELTRYEFLSRQGLHFPYLDNEL